MLRSRLFHKCVRIRKKFCSSPSPPTNFMQPRTEESGHRAERESKAFAPPSLHSSVGWMGVVHREVRVSLIGAFQGQTTRQGREEGRKGGGGHKQSLRRWRRRWRPRNNLDRTCARQQGFVGYPFNQQSFGPPASVRVRVGN